jgi:hypothetical protein
VKHSEDEIESSRKPRSEKRAKRRGSAGASPSQVATLQSVA